MKSVAQTVIEADRFYTIAAHTGNVIQAVEGSKDGGTVRLGKYDHKPEQEWSFVREVDGVYRIRNRASGKLLDLTMTGTANGTWLHLWEDVGGTSQMWTVQPTPEGIPVEVYCFTRETDWVAYEAVQGAVFDHLFAVLPDFGLRAYQRSSDREPQSSES